MTRLGADATSETIAELKALGATFVSRYVSDFPAKNLTLAEAQRLTDAGFDLLTNWENDVNDWQGGYDQGVAYAKKALAQHIACGGRTDELQPYWGIYFSADMQINPEDPRLHAYYDGTRSVLGAHHNGAYAQTSVLRKLRSLGLIGCGDRGGTWRSMSTFGLPEGYGLPGEFDVEQVGQYSDKYDKNVANSSNFGQWRVGAVPAATPQEDDVYLISVTPDPTGAPAGKGAGIFTVDGGAVTHVDGGSLGALKSRFGDPVTVSPAYYQSLLANRTAVTVNLDSAAVAAALASAVPSPAEIAAAIPEHLSITVAAKG